MSVKETSVRKIVTFNEKQVVQIRRLADFFEVSEASIIRLAVDSFIGNMQKLLDWKTNEENRKGYL